MSIEQIIASRLAGEPVTHKHVFVMCGECKEMFCPACVDREFYSYPEWMRHMKCPYCKARFDHELMLKSRRAICRGHHDPTSPPVWRVHKTLKGGRLGNRFKRKRRQLDPDELLEKKWEEEDDYNFWERE